MITFTCLPTITVIFATAWFTDAGLPAHFDVIAQPVVTVAEDNDARLDACRDIRDAQVEAIKMSYPENEIEWIGSTVAFKNGVTGLIK